MIREEGKRTLMYVLACVCVCVWMHKGVSGKNTCVTGNLSLSKECDSDPQDEGECVCLWVGSFCVQKQVLVFVHNSDRW